MAVIWPYSHNQATFQNVTVYLILGPEFPSISAEGHTWQESLLESTQRWVTAAILTFPV